MESPRKKHVRQHVCTCAMFTRACAHANMFTRARKTVAHCLSLSIVLSQYCTCKSRETTTKKLERVDRRTYGCIEGRTDGHSKERRTNRQTDRYPFIEMLRGSDFLLRLSDFFSFFYFSQRGGIGFPCRDAQNLDPCRASGFRARKVAVQKCRVLKVQDNGVRPGRQGRI